MAILTPAEQADRDDATAFTGRVARWDPAGLIRLRADGDTGPDVGRDTLRRAGHPGDPRPADARTM